MKVKPTITVGIPAYNEEGMIGGLLATLRSQRLTSAKLSSIIVVSDGSTDNTINIAKRFAGKIINVVIGKEQRGTAYRQNQLCQKVSSDILVILNADIVIQGDELLERLVSPIVKGKADLTSSRIIALPQVTIMEKILQTSMSLKDTMFSSFRKGNNFYMCHGPARAFSKRLYKEIVFPYSVGEDLYSYLFCVAKGYQFRYVKSSKIYYKLPSTLSDHKKQSARYAKALMLYNDTFGNEFVSEQTTLPRRVFYASVVRFFVLHPMQMALYIAVMIIVRLQSIFDGPMKDIWDIAKSSKIAKGIV